MIVLHDLGFEWFLPFLVTKLIKANMGPKKQQRLTQWEQDEILQSFYAKFEIETDKKVVLRQLIGDNEDVDFNRAESHLSKDEENKVGKADDGADDNLPAADNTDNTHEQPTEEKVLPPNDPIPDLPHQHKFGSLTDALDKSKYVNLALQIPRTYTYTNSK